MDKYLKQEFKLLILNGYYNAQTAHSAIFKDDGSYQPDNPVIIGYLAIANSYINAAKAVYICNTELSRQEFDDFFSEFSAFSDEVMSNIRTDHSHQWSNIHFTRFDESYQPVASLLGIIE